MEEQTLRLSRLEANRDAKRRAIEANFEQRAAVRQEQLRLEKKLQELTEIKGALENDLQGLDEKIATLEHQIVQGMGSEGADTAGGAATTITAPRIEEPLTQPREDIPLSATPSVEVLTDPMLTAATQQQHDDFLTEPPSQLLHTAADPIAEEEWERHAAQRPTSLITPLTLAPAKNDRKRPAETAVAASSPPVNPYLKRATASDTNSTAAASPVNPFFAPRQRPTSLPRDSLQHLSQVQRDNDNNNDEQTARVLDLLNNTFRIPSFRTHQEAIVNATLNQEDVFVIMRTGGGKSLTYQLPALLEGRGPQRKITIVVSPLLSLIQDQEDQLNQFCPGAAVSFTSGNGGVSEQAQRWARVRDRNGGICMILVTPERVSKSGKFMTELQNLGDRLGRFVIDEAHCATQWGHDFRPDYVQLGKLKQNFPHVPVLAVTATASPTVREDVVRILQLNGNYKFFQSSANRPNLHYSVRRKADSKAAVLDDMATFILNHHRGQSGIVYTFSRKEAEDVASQLKERRITAEPYHSSISPTAKKRIHTSWMDNTTQVVVATIAFGLGINKPDVRFVLHHSISKTLEAYYQESGRAGRDGAAASCVLYYSPKDVTKMLGMISGTSAERCTFWPMCRYGQAHGNDAVCRAILLKKLGEANARDVPTVLAENEGATLETRDVTEHVRTLLQLVQATTTGGKKKMTMAMVVKEWRAKNPKFEFLKNNPPNKDLTTEECERIIVTLLIEETFNPRIVTNKYSSCVYLDIAPHVPQMIVSEKLQVPIALPKREASATSATIRTSATTTQNKAPRSTGWTTKTSTALVSKLKAAAPKKKAAPKAPKKKATAPKKKKKATTKTRKENKPRAANRKSAASVIDLLLDDDDDDEEEEAPSTAEMLWLSDDDDDDEYEFEG